MSHPNESCLIKQAARDAPHALAYVSNEVALTYAQLDQYVENLVQLLHKNSIVPGDIIAVSHASDFRLVALLFASARLGASLCPFNTRLPAATRQTYLDRLNPKLCITSLEPFSATQCKKPGTLDPSNLLLFTSGSSGTPKIAALSQNNLIASAIGANSALDLRAGDKWLLSLPLYHVGGIGVVFRCILARATIVVGDHPDITHLSYVSTHLYRATPVYKNLRCVLLGGGPIGSIPERLPVYGTYGLTEMSSLVTAQHRPSKIDGHYHLGAPLAGREVRIASDGEIWVRGECLFQGYLVEGRLQAPGEWFPTGDVGRLSPKEGLAILGRKDALFISGGENIQPEEIEQALLSLAGIEEAVVVPIDDAEFGKRPCAVVRFSKPLTLQQIQFQLTPILPKYKIPSHLISLDVMPRTGIKVDRKKIFEHAKKTFQKT